MTMHLFEELPLLITADDDSTASRSTSSSSIDVDDNDSAPNSPTKADKRKKECVRFDEAFEVIYIEQYTEELKREIWFQKGEYYEINLDRKRTASAYRASLTGYHSGDCSLDEEHHCLRGIESSLCPRSRMQKHARRAAVVRSVLEEQRRQHVGCIYDPESIRQCSVQESMPAMMAAFERAAMDAVQAEQQYSLQSSTQQSVQPVEDSETAENSTYPAAIAVLSASSLFLGPGAGAWSQRFLWPEMTDVVPLKFDYNNVHIR